MTPALKTKAGRLTAYGLACGYTEFHCVDGVALTLYEQHGVYHVRQHDHGTEQRLGTGRIFWNNAIPKLTDARKCFDDAKKDMK